MLTREIEVTYNIKNVFLNHILLIVLRYIKFYFIYNCEKYFYNMTQI